MSITTYTIARGLDSNTLQTAVAALIGTGYQPYGFPFVEPVDSQLAQVCVQGLPASTSSSYTNTEVNISTPLTGATVALTPDAYLYNAVIEPAATIDALTVTVVNGTTAGQQVRIAFTQVVTALTLGPNFVPAIPGLPKPTTAAAGNSFLFVWSVTQSGWVRIE